jgi:hypothetical protein
MSLLKINFKNILLNKIITITMRSPRPKVGRGLLSTVYFAKVGVTHAKTIFFEKH